MTTELQSKSPDISRLPLPNILEAWAFVLSKQTNEKIVMEILGNKSSDGKYGRGSVLDRPPQTADQRRKILARRRERNRNANVPPAEEKNV